MGIDIKTRLPEVRGKYRFDVPLGELSWFNTGGHAEVVFSPADLNDLQSFLQKLDPEIPLFCFGVGSNTLVREGGVKGVVLRLGRAFNYIEIVDKILSNDANSSDDVSSIEIRAGASVLDLNFALFAMENGVGNLEFFSGIPGSIGGALSMNAGAYGNDTASVLVTAQCINREGNIEIFTPEQIGYKYRGRSLSKEWIFIEGIFKGHKDDKSLIAAKIKDIQNKRITTQPIKSKTGGSTFKNPSNTEYKAWQLIDNAECRGLRVGGAHISDLHANFIINDQGGTSQDIEDLIEKVKTKVYQKTGIILEEEIVMIGDKK